MKRRNDGHAEIMRRLRLGDVRRLLRHRYGPVLPDDDAGREDLRELLLPISLGNYAGKKMRKAIELWARWLPQDEAELLIADIERTEPKLRRRTGKDLGERMRLTNAERERLRLWTIAACDVTAEERVECRKQKERDRKRRRRAANGSRPRAEYEANSISRTKPWIAEGYNCRRTWERHRNKANVASASAVKSLKAEDTLATLQAEPQQEAVRGRGFQGQSQEPRGRTRLEAAPRLAS
jgi:hypothetical protein